MECAHACKDTPGCTHFDFYLSNGDCNKKRSTNIKKSDAYWKGDGVFCGILSQESKSLNVLFFKLE